MAKVLLVEDDNNLREIYQARLMAEGYEIVAAQNGEEALVVAKQNKPDLIISDVMMPRISGFEMLDILRNTNELKHTKVIMLTALGQAEDQKRADNLGADKYLVKSQVTLEDIVNAAKELLDEEGAATSSSVSEASVQAETAAAAPEPAPAPAAPVAEPAGATPAVTEATPATTPAAEPVADASPAAAPVADEPASLATPPADTVTPTPEESAETGTAAPASVVPQPGTTVVVPPAPANPTPPTVTTVATDSVTPPAPDPVPAPEPAPAPAAPVADEPTTVTPAPEEPATAAAPPQALSDAQSLEAEEAALQAQIDNYAKEPAETPQQVTPDQAASNDEAIAEAVEELNTPADEKPLDPPSVANAPEAPPAAAAPAATESAPAAVPNPAPAAPAEPPAANPDNASVAGKKVIQPLNENLNKPDLNELLAKEEATAPPATPTPVVGSSSEPAKTAPVSAPPAQPGQSFDPNSVAL